MASYTAAQTRGSGSLGEELPSTGIDFFITNSLNSQGNYPVGYLTLEGNATANQNLSTDAAMTGSFSNIVGGITEKSIVTSETKWSLSVFGSGGSFRFTPDSTVAANSYYIKGVGPFKLDIGPSSPPSPPGYNNQYSFFFDNDGVTHPLIEDKQFFTRPNTPAFNLTNDFTLSIWAKVLISDPPDDGKLFDNATGGGSGGNGFLLYHDNVSSGKWNWEIRNSGGGNTSDRVLRVRSTSSPVSNTWVHLGGVFKDGTATLYIDGVNDRELSYYNYRRGRV